MVLDTNALIYFLGGEEKIIKMFSEWRQAGRPLVISSISVAEIFSSPVSDETEIRIIKRFLAEFVSVPFDDNIAERSGYFRRVYRLSLPDAAIVATAFLYHMPLVTRDKKLQKVKEVRMVEI